MPVTSIFITRNTAGDIIAQRFVYDDGKELENFNDGARVGADVSRSITDTSTTTLEADCGGQIDALRLVTYAEDNAADGFTFAAASRSHAIIGGTFGGTVTEDTNLSASGSFVVTDASW